ncbi:LamG-like jellyroll fold domain-containing protein [Thalassobellus citreus]|uniref:LamG-like jellyroll fold domain-containing protein n=1 Tax=Thalassobellus citreus TaxID=3367752 RepID=UPI0037B1FA8E
MKLTKTLNVFFICFLFFFKLSAQTCEIFTFAPPNLPSSFTYTYTDALGWVDSMGSSIAAPSSVGGGDSVAILDDNSDVIANSGFKGFLYIAPGVTYSGTISSINGANVLVEGNIDFPTNPSFQNVNLYIYETGSVFIPGTFNPSGSSKIFNAGQSLNIGGDLQLGGSVEFVSFSTGSTIVQGDASIASEYSNCGLLEVYGSLSSGGASSLKNNCSVYIHTDMSLNADYTNNGLFVLDGNLNFGTATFFNNDAMVLNNISLSNDDLIGNDVNSVLIVRNTASLTSGASITGHMYYDIDDGGGFDTVCASCVEDVDVLLDVTIPATTAEILENCGGNIIINPFIVESKLDFDGVDDYLSTPEFINGLNDVTLMAWVKSDTGNTTDMTIAGEGLGCKMSLKNGNRPTFTITTASNSTQFAGGCSCSAINLDEWHHITGSFSSNTGLIKIYVDGVLVDTQNTGITGASIQNTVSSNGNFEVGRTSEITANREYFKGDIDEVRVFNKLLTDDQIQQMVYQEIEENSGNVKGVVISKDISTNNPVLWSSLIAYYPMLDIVSYDRTTDYSLNNRITKLHNITSMQQQTAPMPYQSLSDGSWSLESTWLHGDVWDIEDAATNKDWSIVKILSDVNANHNVKTLGLIIDTDKKLTVQGDYLVENSSYLELNGTLDLQDDSQLIQTSNSDLVTSSTGKIKRRQEGTASAYWYNYWASPVGATGVTILSDNNGAINNSNNSDYRLELLKDDSEMNCQFTSAYTANGNISTYWLYTFINGKTYWDWAQIAPSANLKPGVGYTQKGTGIPDSEQQYIFEGKPNNGTILVDVTDVGGPGSVANVSKTEYLLGNPYPSALDIYKFIDDNAGIIDGTLNLWQQWSGSSHNLDEYNGGYAQVNKLGSIRAYQFVGFYGATNGQQDGTITPSRYLPVGQGFIVEIITDGTVEFNNSQRVFIKEADADGTYDNGSVFSKSGNSKSSKSNTSNKEVIDNSMQKLRLEFNSVIGPKTRRELLLGFSPDTSDEYDYGFDAKNTEVNNNDLHLSLDGQDMNIQAYSEITADKVVPLNFKSSGSNTFDIKITELENIDESQEIYLKDNQTGTYFNLREDTAYQFTSDQGKFNTRFEIVFQSEQQSLSTEEALATENFIYYKNSDHKLYAKKLNTSVSKISLVNMLGQTVLEFREVSQESLNNGLNISNISSGTYVTYFRTEDHQVFTKKIIVN